MELEKKFRVLTIIALAYDVLAVLLIVLILLLCLAAIIAAIVLESFGALLAIITILVNIVVGMIVVIATKAVAETIRVFLSIEENTRKISILTEQMHHITENTHATAVILHNMNQQKK